jgi:hypothetical protein
MRAEMKAVVITLVALLATSPAFAFTAYVTN